MHKLEEAIEKAGFNTVNVSYPSTDFPIEKLAGPAIAPALDRCRLGSNTGAQIDTLTNAPENIRINFVTHSMGGILVRQYLSQVKVENLGRVVMLGPPNQGSEVVDKLGSFPGFHFIFGDAGLQLGTGKISTGKASPGEANPGEVSIGKANLPNKLGAADFDVGIIAGTKSINPILSTLLPNKDDGKVTVESTRLAGMRDHLEMPVTHVFMMKNRKVIEQTIHYLRHGRFKREAGSPTTTAPATESAHSFIPASATTSNTNTGVSAAGKNGMTAKAQRKKIQFSEGSPSTTHEGHSSPGIGSAQVAATIHGHETVEYLVDAKTGQSLQLDMRSSNKLAGYRITAPAAPRPLYKGHGQHAQFSVTLPRDGTYRVLIYLGDEAAERDESANFSLNIQLRNPG